MKGAAARAAGSDCLPVYRLVTDVDSQMMVAKLCWGWGYPNRRLSGCAWYRSLGEHLKYAFQIGMQFEENCPVFCQYSGFVW